MKQYKIMFHKGNPQYIFAASFLVVLGAYVFFNSANETLNSWLVWEVAKIEEMK